MHMMEAVIADIYNTEYTISIVTKRSSENAPVVDFFSIGITVAFRLAPRSSSQKVSKGSRR